MAREQLDTATETELARKVRDGKLDIAVVSRVCGLDVANAVALRIQRWDEIQTRSDAAEDRLVKQGFFGR